jgi:hypothetical protein
MAPPFVITAALLPLKKRWLIYAPVVITLCGFWSLVPDVSVYYGRKLGLDEMRGFMHDKIGNLFFFHKAMDLLSGEIEHEMTPPPEAAAGRAPRPAVPRIGVGGVWGLMAVACMYLCIILGYVVYIRRLLAELREQRVLIKSLSARSGDPPSRP